MKVRFWGTRGSIACSGPATVRYGGNTSCVEIRESDGYRLILDAGTGIRPIGLDAKDERFDILLTHLHMDHIQGLPFFGPLLDPTREVHIWGPISTTSSLRERLGRYLSPPLFPVRIRELSNVHFHDVPPSVFEVGPFTVKADLIIHPGATLGYRISLNGAHVAYLPDHEPALANGALPDDPEWISGFDLLDGATVLIHDSQYTDSEYRDRVGWGHSSSSHLASLAEMAKVDRLVPFHHDPGHDDGTLDEMIAKLSETTKVEVVPGQEASVVEV